MSIVIEPVIPQIKDHLNGGETPVSEPLGGYLMDLLDEVNIKPEAAAKLLRIDLSELMDVLNNVAPVTPRLAYKLDAAGMFYTADEWLSMQLQHDLFKCYDDADYEAIREEAKTVNPNGNFDSTSSMRTPDIQDRLLKLNLLAGKPERLQVLWNCLIDLISGEDGEFAYGMTTFKGLTDVLGCGKNSILGQCEQLQKMNLMIVSAADKRTGIQYAIPLSLLEKK